MNFDKSKKLKKLLNSLYLFLPEVFSDFPETLTEVIRSRNLDMETTLTHNTFLGCGVHFYAFLNSYNYNTTIKF